MSWQKPLFGFCHTTGFTTETCATRLLVNGRCARGFHSGDAILHRLLHLREGAHLNLAHALRRHAELIGKPLERDRLVGEPPRLEDATLTAAEHGKSFAQRLAPIVELLAV